MKNLTTNLLDKLNKQNISLNNMAENITEETTEKLAENSLETATETNKPADPAPADVIVSSGDSQESRPAGQLPLDEITATVKKNWEEDEKEAAENSEVTAEQTAASDLKVVKDAEPPIQDSTEPAATKKPEPAATTKTDQDDSDAVFHESEEIPVKNENIDWGLVAFIVLLIGAIGTGLFYFLKKK